MKRNTSFDVQNFVTIPSTDIVPGDVLVVPNKMKIPCDAILISGDLLLNEASMTGESIPIP